MQVESLPNKFKIFQDYYLYVNGEIISYSEALRLYSQLDSDAKLDFEKFYKDETGYEIITPNGYGLDYSGKLETDENGNLSRYKVKDPSFNNWYGLAMAVRNNGISDFPLCNKSFNLSYCGNDL